MGTLAFGRFHPLCLAFSASAVCQHHLRTALFLIHFIYFCFLGLHSQHVEVPRLGVEPELHLPAYTTATATPDP